MSVPGPTPLLTEHRIFEPQGKLTLKKVEKKAKPKRGDQQKLKKGSASTSL